jgi:hypothetical protein
MPPDGGAAGNNTGAEPVPASVKATRRLAVRATDARVLQRDSMRWWYVAIPPP